MPFELPTVPDLLRHLAKFCEADGRIVDRVLRKKVPHVRLRFDKVSADGGDELTARLFEHPEDTIPALRSIQARLRSAHASGPVGELLDALCTMASTNRVDPNLAKRLANIAGESAYSEASDTILEPSQLGLRPLVRNAMRRSFEQTLLQTGDLSPSEREYLEQVIFATSNVEDLLAFHFTRFVEGGLPDRRTYLYIVWILWAFLRVRSAQALWPSRSFYAVLKALELDVITFNYTDFLGPQHPATVLHFHGKLDAYLRIDNRQVVAGDPRQLAVIDPESAADFIDSLRLDVSQGNKLDIPAMVPPATFKPVLSREQLRTWNDADELLQHADNVIIVGYSFAQADEHFNDLLRKGNPMARITLINPDAGGPTRRLHEVLGLAEASFEHRTHSSGYPMTKSGRVTCIQARGEQLTPKDVRLLLTSDDAS